MVSVKTGKYLTIGIIAIVTVVFVIFLSGQSQSFDKFTLWQQPSFFRGAAVHPYAPYGEEEGRIYITKQDFQDLRKKGANVVSLNYPGPFKVSPPYEIDKDALKYLDDAIKWSEEVGLYAIIHFRNGPGKSEKTFYGEEEGKEDEIVWHSEKAKAKWVQMWQFVAQRYRDKPHIVGYNLMVEPHPEYPVKQKPLNAEVWIKLAKRITNAIRKVDKDTPIIIGATVWSNPIAFADLKPTGDERTIYSFHMYEPFDFTHQGLEWAGKGAVSVTYPGMIHSDITEDTRYWNKTLIEEFLQPVLAFQKENNVPIFVGEFGCNRRVASCITYLKDLLEIFEANGFSYTYYVWNLDDDFDYQKEVSGDGRVAESQYMRLFKKYWGKNETPLKSETKVEAKAVRYPAMKTLKELAAARGLRIGGFYQYDIRDDTYNAVFAQEYNVMTVYMGWEGGVDHMSRASYDFAASDGTVDFGIKHGFEIHGHPLVWFDDIVPWVKETSLAEIEKVMNEHIDTVVGRYAGRIKLWDVVNEAVDENGNLRRNHRWIDAMGSDYISKAFIRAHKADPNAILQYNEGWDLHKNPARFNGVKALLQSLLDKGVPVHALGWQMHVKPGEFDPETLLAWMNEIADMGIDNYITELDVELPEDANAEDYEKQKQTYKSVIEVFLKARRHKTLVMWGLRDGDPNWLTNNHHLPFDENFKKKPAYYGIQEALLDY